MHGGVGDLILVGWVIHICPTRAHEETKYPPRSFPLKIRIVSFKLPVFIGVSARF